ncbi:MAG: endonuclease [Humidesulfovibrio sp.]|uniref:endonuclease n=1 Tax=Humidesulfovibrio sp. TaxID=2910988 RepID=UPI0027F54020|nr:endonuclease [Humidesulfovibrio sp.]MDQ7834201.1 endonuclease [Humidesulfovibrio sp.]
MRTNAPNSAAKRLASLLACCLLAFTLLSCGDKDKAEREPGEKAQETAQPRGNTREDSFQGAKRTLERLVYSDHRITFYCQAPFGEDGAVSLPPGFTTPKHRERARRIEWEHVVPAENFGRTFPEWRDGHPDCQDRRGPFKGRKCAERVSKEYRLMQADMYNLYPAIGAVNALRSNYSFAMLPGAPNSFGTCAMKIEGNKAEPPEHARGAIARTTKYMAWAYPRFNLSRQQEQLMNAWDDMYPVDQWECTRARRIEDSQGNENPLVKTQCQQAGLWQ